ncbi:MAG: TIGR03862 family flavoprotein [Paracoccaceae bacterium]
MKSRTTSRAEALVIGSGPAGLMAAERLATRGLYVIVAEGKSSPGRKFLMAGKSGLNLTKAEPPGAFNAAFAEAEDWLAPILAAFGPEEAQNWARGLGQEVFTGSSGRVFPTAMKASALLRAWLARLEVGGVQLRRNRRWTGWSAGARPGFRFDTPEGEEMLYPAVTVLALGGASWARLGSDGAWAPLLAAKGAPLAPFRPANMGFKVAWSAHMARHFGQPVKTVALCAGGVSLRGELVISARGIEGGGVYGVSRALRDGAPLSLDLTPDLSAEEVARRLSRPQGGASLGEHIRKSLRLDPVKRALLNEFARPLPSEPGALAARIKGVEVKLEGPRPIDEAISTAGGVMRAGLDEGLMLRAAPGVFCAGEMLDWEAPTGGYLITACLATGRWAGDAAARWISA